MTISIDDEASKRGPAGNSVAANKLGFGDPNGALPRQKYFFGPTTNLAARGERRNELSTGGGLDGLSFNLPPAIASQYPYNNVNETISGHVIEYDDTPGGERILIKHKSGSGVELRADGSIVMKTESNIVTSVSGSSALIVEGDVDIRANGNMTLKVAGDLNIDVGGNINIAAGGDKKENVSGSSREMVYGTKGSVVRGSRSSTTVGIQTDTCLAGLNTVVKGANKHTVSGDYNQAVGGNSKLTSAGGMVISTPDMSMAAASLSIFGASGTIGGAGIVHYGANMRATTFHGDLEGTARFSINADITNFQNFPANSVGSQVGYSVDLDNTQTAAADATIMDAYLNQSANGVVQVTVDEGDFIKNSIDRTFANGGISHKDLSTRETRSKLRDPATMGNSEFVGNAVASGKISGNYATSVPSGVDRIASSTGTVRTPAQPIVSKLAVVERYQPEKSTSPAAHVPPAEFTPTTESGEITADFKLAKGITLAKFLGGTGEKVTLAHIETNEEKVAIARQFTLHANAMSTILNNTGEFKNHRLVVVEGLYKKGEKEVLTAGSINDKATRGLVVVYELHDSTGKIDLDKTFELATYWKDSIQYNKLILSYDTFDPSGQLTCQIILIMPEINENFEGVYANVLETQYNNAVQSDELIEILPETKSGPQ